MNRWCPVLASLFVVLLVEAAHQLLEDGAHTVVVQPRWGEIEVWSEELLDQRTERVSLRKPR